jgi:cytochrome c-type biogenesis protein CcmH/NrfG
VIVSGVIAAGGRELVQTNSADAQKTAAIIAWNEKDYSKAALLLEKYTVAKPDDDIGLIMLAEAYESNNQPNKAIGALEQALRVNPNSQDARQELEQLRSSTSPEKK